MMTAEQAVTALRHAQAMSDAGTGFGIDDDPEAGHALADNVLLDLLDAHGFHAVTMEFRKVFKWYA